ncbi:MAG: hypothetical protein JWL82_21 [Parcubacteria group bacterium]|nr:hypothetical protein [Parcubacteria group bacterium]
MNSFSSNCTLIETSRDRTALKKLLLDADNTFGPMGSGGYEIREHNPLSEAVAIAFVQLDCLPAPRYFAFIQDGKIWVTHMTSWVVDHLRQRGIDFSSKQVPNPDFIEHYVRALPERS